MSWRRVLASAVLLAAPLFAIVSTVLAPSSGASARQIQLANAAYSPQGIALDAAGDLFIADEETGDVYVLPKTTGTIFGQSVIADQEVELAAASTLEDSTELAFDSAGNLYVANNNSLVSVIPISSGTLFGQSVTADIPTTIVSMPEGTVNDVAVDSSGNLWMTNDATAPDGGGVYVLPASGTTTVFGASVSAGVLTDVFADGSALYLSFDNSGNLWFNLGNEEYIVTPTPGTYFGVSITTNGTYETDTVVHIPNVSAVGGALAFDAAGNIYIGTSTATEVVPVSTGAIFGISITSPYTEKVLETYPEEDGGESIAVDSSGNVYASTGGDGDAGVTVLSSSSGMIFGQQVEANTPTVLGPTTVGLYTTAMVTDSAGDLFAANGQGLVTVRPAYSGTLFGQSVTAGVETTLLAADSINFPAGIALDSAGNLYISDPSGGGGIYVLPETGGTLFGQTVTADTLKEIVSGSDAPSANYLMVGPDGSVFWLDTTNALLRVLPVSTGNVFGQGVTADTPATLLTGLSLATGAGINSAGDIFIAENGEADAYVPTSTTLFGQSVPADALTPLTASAGGASLVQNIVFDAAGDMFLSNINGAPVVVPVAEGTFFGQANVPADHATLLSAATGDAAFAIAVDSLGNLYYADNAGNIWVLTSGPSVTTSSLPNLTDSTAYSQTLTDVGGIPGLDWSVSSGSLPVGLSLNSTTGVISGTPTAAGSSFTVKVEDSLGSATTQPLSILESQTVSFASTAPTSATVDGTPYAVSATSSLGLTVTVTVDSLSSSVCTISGSAVSFTASGICVLDANQSGTSAYSAAAQVQQLFGVTGGSGNGGGGGSGGGGSTTPTTPTPAGNTGATGTTGLTPAPPPIGVPTVDLGVPTSEVVGSGVVTAVQSDAAAVSADVVIPSNALPMGTTVSVYPVTDVAAVTTGLPAGTNAVVAFVVSWEAPDGSVPTASSLISMTIVDPSDQSGDQVYAITPNGVTIIGTESVAGTVTITFSSDPTLVVAQPGVTPTRTTPKVLETLTIYGVAEVEPLPGVVTIKGVKFRPVRKLVIVSGSHRGTYFGLGSGAVADKLAHKGARIIHLYSNGDGRFVL